MALGSTQPLAESALGKGGHACKVDNLTKISEPIVRLGLIGRLDVTKSCGLPCPITRVTLRLLLRFGR
jgi:hypothetical protein